MLIFDLIRLIDKLFGLMMENNMKQVLSCAAILDKNSMTFEYIPSELVICLRIKLIL